MAEQETKQDLIAAAKSLPQQTGGNFSLRPRNFEEAFRFANLIAESDLIPKDFRGKPANVLIAVQLGMELGIPPMQAIQNIAVINGRPTLWGDLIPALMYQSGLCEQFDEQGDAAQATCTVKRKGFAPITRTFTIEEAKKISYSEWIDNKKVQTTLSEKQTYKSYPKRMLQMRARAYAVRDAFPDVLKGVSIREEVEDFEAVDVTPMPAKPALRKPEPLPEKTDGQKQQANKSSHDGDSNPNGQSAGPLVGAGKASQSALPLEPPAVGANRSQEQAEPSPDTCAILAHLTQCSDKDFKEISQDKRWLGDAMKGKSTPDGLLIANAIVDRRKALGL